jgi:hypothetical protein
MHNVQIDGCLTHTCLSTMIFNHNIHQTINTQQIIPNAVEKEISILIYGGGPLVYLILAFGCSATLEFSIVLDSKGIREAVQEKQPIKALNSFAFRDIIDGVGK